MGKVQKITQILNEDAIEIDNFIKKHKRKCEMSDNEMITIMVLFYLKNCRRLKHLQLNTNVSI